MHLATRDVPAYLGVGVASKPYFEERRCRLRNEMQNKACISSREASGIRLFRNSSVQDPVERSSEVSLEHCSLSSTCCRGRQPLAMQGVPVYSGAWVS
jgi:hypothetical protein